MPKTNQNSENPQVDDGAAKPQTSKIDPNALAGTKNSLGGKSVNDVRPSTDDSVVEGMDEATPVTPGPPDR
ncbi:MAG: hypothetical protein M3O31_14925 [Acidobacteriota bacterium]|nr:hypothetical protein [Acidobacteriota bacterium]